MKNVVVRQFSYMMAVNTFSVALHREGLFHVTSRSLVRMLLNKTSASVTYIRLHLCF